MSTKKYLKVAKKYQKVPISTKRYKMLTLTSHSDLPSAVYRINICQCYQKVAQIGEDSHKNKVAVTPYLRGCSTAKVVHQPTIQDPFSATKLLTQINLPPLTFYGLRPQGDQNMHKVKFEYSKQNILSSRLCICMIQANICQPSDVASSKLDMQEECH